jgi:hypothetical protein
VEVSSDEPIAGVLVTVQEINGSPSSALSDECPGA